MREQNRSALISQAAVSVNETDKTEKAGLTSMNITGQESGLQGNDTKFVTGPDSMLR